MGRGLRGVSARKDWKVRRYTTAVRAVNVYAHSDGSSYAGGSDLLAAEVQSVINAMEKEGYRWVSPAMQVGTAPSDRAYGKEAVLLYFRKRVKS